MYSNNENTIYWSQIGSFKGLENEYIIALEIPSGKISDKNKALYYVALTRSKTGFYLIYNKGSEIGDL